MLDRDNLVLACKNGFTVVYEDKLRSFSMLGRITGIITRFEKGVCVLSAEVKDIRANCVYRCDPKDLSLWQGQAIETRKEG